MTTDRTESEMIEMFEMAVEEMVSIEQSRQVYRQGEFNFGRLESLGTNTGCYRVLPATTEE